MASRQGDEVSAGSDLNQHGDYSGLAVHKNVAAWLKPGGVYLLEAYAPDQIQRNTGGPKDPSLLASLETILAELAGLKIEHQAALVRNITEGRFHTGEASVVQVMARRR